MKTPKTALVVSLLWSVLFLLFSSTFSINHAQQLNSFERERGRMMLNIIKDDLKEHYYDITFRGMNVDESFKTAEEKIKQATSTKSFPNVILDLRGNGGGYVDTLRHMVGYFNEGEIKIADFKMRKEIKPIMSKKVGAFEGKLVVIVDSDSASCAELFPRVMQLLKRAVVIGDRTAGAVMMSRQYRRAMGIDSLVFYGTSITEADVIMTDGKSLEHTGMILDELLIPTPEDLSKGRDPVLARAAEVLGFKLDPEKAGTLFPIEWPR